MRARYCTRGERAAAFAPANRSKLPRPHEGVACPPSADAQGLGQCYIGMRVNAAEQRPPSSDWAGDIVGGRYRLESPIGRGGMATVWRAVHLDLNRPVAVKFLTIHGGHPEQVKDRFLREARIAAAVRHRNVVDITDFGTTPDGRPFMVMELLEGKSLAERMNEQPLFGVPDVIRIGARVLSGLGAVHDAGIVHRDLKPENVFLVRDADGVYAKLLDFGISRSVEADLESVVPSSDSVLAGTPQYMSPEQARGIRDVDHRSDLWAVGVLLYEMLTGALPFDSEHVGDLIVKIMSEEPIPVQTLRPDLGEPLARVVHRALARDRAERFQTAREMRQSLLNAATMTAKALHSSEVEHPAMLPKELMDAVGNAYEPGDSGALHVVDLASLPAERSSVETLLEQSGKLPLQAGGTSDERARRLPWLALVAAVLLGAAVLAFFWGAGTDPSASTAVDPAPPRAAAVGADPVTVTLRRMPRGAAITVDGRRHDGPALTLPRSGREHVIEVNAPGFEPWRVTHKAEGDAAYDVRMSPLEVSPEATDEGPQKAPVAPGEMIRDPGF